jgi:hypothetical protein
MWLLAMALGALLPDKRPDRRRLAHWLGLAGPEMRPHWARLRHQPSLHALANIATEWTRADPQRAWKTYAAAIDLLILAILIWSW